MARYILFLSAFMDIALYLATVSGQECGTLPVIDNSNNDVGGSPPYAEDTVVRYTCQNLYRPQGHSLFTCTSGGWIGGPFSCRQVECSGLEAPLHGRIIVSSYVVGSIMRFECDMGYELQGETQSLCQSDSNWNPPTVPTCRIKTCPAIPHIQNGKTVVEKEEDGEVNVYGGVLRVECHASYIVSGPVRIRCDENGQWTRVPTCSRVTCPPYQGLDGKCVLKSKLESQYLFLYCTDNSTFIHGGEEVAYCDNGNWDDPSMRCYCDCAVNADTTLVELGNLNAKGFLKHNQPLSWICKGGSRKASNVELRCYDGIMNGTPECIRAPTQPSPPSPTTKPGNKTTDKNVTVPGDKDEGTQPGLIIAILAVLVTISGVVAGTLIAKKKKCLCFKNNPNSNVNANESDLITEKAATVHYTNEKTDPNEKHPLDETEKVAPGKEDVEKTPLMPFNNDQNNAEKGMTELDIGKEATEENKP